MTLQLALTVVTMTTTSLFDRVPDDALAQIAQTGRAYTGEVKRMAQELIELRAKLNAEPPTEYAPYAWNGPAATP